MKCTYDLTESEIMFIKTHLKKEPAEYMVTVTYPMDNVTPLRYEIHPRMIYNENKSYNYGG